MLEPRVQQHFFESADLGYQAAESIARPIADAAQALVDCLTAGGRALVHGRGVAHAPATLLGAALSGRFERERPGLAAIVLATDALTLSSASPSSDPALAQLRALGGPGDVLVAFALHASDPQLAALVEAAHERELSVVVVTGRDPAAVASAAAGAPVLAETDVRITIPHERAARVCELQLVSLHALCDAVDLQLLGDADLS